MYTAPLPIVGSERSRWTRTCAVMPNGFSATRVVPYGALPSASTAINSAAPKAGGIAGGEPLNNLVQRGLEVVQAAGFGIALHDLEYAQHLFWVGGDGLPQIVLEPEVQRVGAVHGLPECLGSRGSTPSTQALAPLLIAGYAGNQVLGWERI